MRYIFYHHNQYGTLVFDYYDEETHLYLTSLEHPIQLPHKQYSHSFFIAFRGGCCSTSQRENQLHGKILLKTLILNNRVRLDKEFGSFSFTIVFFAQILWRLISSTATIFSF